MDIGRRSMTIVKFRLSDKDIEFEKVLKAIREGRIKGIVNTTFLIDDKGELFYEIEGQLTSFETLPREKVVGMMLGNI